jgi:DNA gyrase subunit A
MGRTASGVKGITLESDTDEVIGMVCADTTAEVQNTILVVSEKGYGKRTELDDYRITGRGGKGVKTMNITDKTGDLIAIKSVNDEDGLMIINRSGIVIRLKVSSLRVMGRATQGVRLINIKENDQIASVAKVESMESGEEEIVSEILNEENIDLTENTTNETDSNSDIQE